MKHVTQREYWRSLDHLANTPQVRELGKHEFASYDPEEMKSFGSVSRRRFMQLMSASMALAGLALSGCRRWPEEHLAPFTSRPHDSLPGVPRQYASIYEIDGVGRPLLITCFDGRPIKVDGNPLHPFSATVQGKIGSADAISQASVLDVYDPERSRTVVASGKETEWQLFVNQMKPLASSLAEKQGDGLAFLCEPSSSPSTGRLIAAVAAKYPKASWYEYAPLVSTNEASGIKQSIGRTARLNLHLDKAKVIVSIDADLLGSHPAHTRYAGDWAVGRRTADSGSMSRMYIAESVFSITGTVADGRLPSRPSRLGAILTAVASGLGVGSYPAVELSADEKPFVAAVIKDIQANSGAAVIAIGSHLPAELHALGLAINAKIGAIGATLTLLDAPDSAAGSINDLVTKMKAKGVDTLVMLGGNPVYDAPADLDFASALKNVANSIHLSLYYNETSHLVGWHVPKAHYLEAWGDARSWDGAVSVCQPTILPLFNGKTSDETLALIAGETELDSYSIVQKTFKSILTAGDFDLSFKKVLNAGLVDGSAFGLVNGVTPAAPASITVTPAAANFEIRFQQDSRVYDGRFANNGWLEELPDPLTKLVWDNAALVSVRDAKQAGINNGDILNLTVNGRSLQIAAYILPGQPLGVIGMSLGYGRTAAGNPIKDRELAVGDKVGFDSYTIRTVGSEFVAAGATMAKTGDTYPLAMTQNHHLMDEVGMEGRAERVGKDKYEDSDIIREAKLSEYAKDNKLFQRNEDGSIALPVYPPELFEPPMNYTTADKETTPHRWGMAIDMNSCIGCHACVTACQSENNIPIVGKDHAMNGRAMHWIRIDRYFKGEAEEPSPEVTYQPLTCQQCENAPCEQVCPVGATMHDTEGINVMVYNRCVGTRYCSNNCPYKVRRFNYLDFHSQDPRTDKYPKPYLGIPDQQQMDQVDKIKAMVFNPEVTVRMRGVMEKCNFCLQRIHNTQINKRNAGEELQDGDVVTACQQACPTQAIVFGDLADPNSKVSQWHKNNRAYGLLAETLNTRPRNRYLAKISNPPEA